MESESESLIPIRPGLAVPRREIRLEFSHAQGPGGQNVNKVATGVTLCFHPESSAALSPEEKALIMVKLARRINSAGVLRVSSSAGRSQGLNRELAVARFRELLALALKPVRRRRPSRPTPASRERRLEEKRRAAARKAGRGRAGDAAD